MGTYKTKSGDTWDIISFNTYGTESKVGVLIDANKEHIETVIFSSGIQLQIPSINDEAETSEDLPPWKRGEVDAG